MGNDTNKLGFVVDSLKQTTIIVNKSRHYGLDLTGNTLEALLLKIRRAHQKGASLPDVKPVIDTYIHKYSTGGSTPSSMEHRVSPISVQTLANSTEYPTLVAEETLRFSQPEAESNDLLQDLFFPRDADSAFTSIDDALLDSFLRFGPPPFQQESFN